MLAPRENPRLFGHVAALQTFARATQSGRLPHAWLLFGAFGIGKATLAYRLARRMLAGDLAPADPTAEEDAGAALFRRVAHGSEPDLFVLERTPHPRTGRMRHEITIDQVRAVTAGLHETAMGAAGRAVVVDAADHLNAEAANAFLKLLEEPPRGVVLFLVCHATGRVPRTLLSRCVRLPLQPLDDREMSAALAASGIAADPSASLLALAKGSPGQYARCAGADCLAHYEALLSGLVSGGKDPLPLLETAERLAGVASSAGADLVTELLRLVVQRGAEQALGGTLAPPLVAEEADRLATVAGRQPLDRWLALWDKLQRLPFDLEQLNVDSRQALFLALAALAGRTEARRGV